ncbi:hypothetical protein GCM10022383_27490 [Microbacterium soli]|uniref:Uncharacterized protein n=2 Tax=Microbacterium soli TaxID=446075 RepID=A0ABP7NIV2_9MICO
MQWAPGSALTFRGMGILMVKTMVAKSGRTVTQYEDGSISIGQKRGYLSREAAFDAAEFFEMLRDEERGWWRSPADPHMVCVEGPAGRDGRRTVKVVDEDTFVADHLNDRVLDITRPTAMQRAARDFLLAHPVPKPWHEAEPGQFWRVEHMGLVETCRVDDVNERYRFRGVDGGGTHVDMPVTHPSITGAVQLVVSEPSSQAGLASIRGAL